MSKRIQNINTRNDLLTNFRVFFFLTQKFTFNFPKVKKQIFELKVDLSVFITKKTSPVEKPLRFKMNVAAVERVVD